MNGHHIYGCGYNYLKGHRAQQCQCTCPLIKSRNIYCKNPSWTSSSHTSAYNMWFYKWYICYSLLCFYCTIIYIGEIDSYSVTWFLQVNPFPPLKKWNRLSNSRRTASNNGILQSEFTLSIFHLLICNLVEWTPDWLKSDSIMLKLVYVENVMMFGHKCIYYS
jgi:hypothetical protein